jgi:hypothetical protein
MRPALLPFAAALLATAPAMAEPWACDFTVECLVGDGCDESGLQVQIIAADHAGDLFLSSVTGDSPVTRMTAAGALPATYVSAGQAGLAELLTIEADRTALMTIHMFDGAAAAITFFGTCEELT